MPSTGGWLALSLVGFMLIGGIWSLIVDHAWLGGSVWAISGLILLPPIQERLARIGIEIPPLVSLVLFVCSFIGGLLLMR